MAIDDDGERAWAAVHDAVARLPGWAVGPCQFHADGDRWHVAAIHLAVRGRQAKREAIEAIGATEIAALRALVESLEVRAAAGSRAELNRRLRAAFVEGAVEDSRRRLGRGLTGEELERVLQRYPGDVDQRPRR